jgi:hypothetical protein
MLRFMVQALQDPPLCSSTTQTSTIIPDKQVESYYFSIQRHIFGLEIVNAWILVPPKQNLRSEYSETCMNINSFRQFTVWTTATRIFNILICFCYFLQASYIIYHTEHTQIVDDVRRRTLWSDLNEWGGQPNFVHLLHRYATFRKVKYGSNY